MLADFKNNPELELIFVMVILPVTLNSIQVNFVINDFSVLDLRQLFAREQIY